jgi:DNA-binding Xre family transcriptional regulator
MPQKEEAIKIITFYLLLNSNLNRIYNYSKFGIIIFNLIKSFCSMGHQFIDKESLKSIRERLWQISNKKKIGLEDIQDRTGFSYSQVYRIVRGKNNISVSGLIAVCKALEIQPSEIFDFQIDIPKHSPTRKNFNL